MTTTKHTLIPQAVHDAGPQARYDWLKANPGAMAQSMRGDVVAENTFAPTLTTQFLLDGSTTLLQNMLPALSCLPRDFSTDQYKPLAVANAKFVTLTDGNVQTNATNFEQGDSTVADTQITPAQITRSFHVDNSQLNSGLRMEDLLKINLAVFCDAIMKVVNTTITGANFPTAPMVHPPGAFGWGDMQTLWGQLKKSPIKNAILDGEYLAQIINVPTQFQKTGAEAGKAWAPFGWDNIALNTNWTGADANVRGFACNPQAIGVLAGLPVEPPRFGSGSLTRSVLTVPGLELSVALHQWFQLSARTLWYSFDVMLGASALDSTAGIIIRSA